MYGLISLLLLVAMDAAWKPGMLLLLIPVIGLAGILLVVYTARKRANKRHTNTPV